MSSAVCARARAGGTHWTVEPEKFHERAAGSTTAGAAHRSLDTSEMVGARVGCWVGCALGAVGTALGCAVGAVGVTVGCSVGRRVEGAAVGVKVGALVGAVGTDVGAAVGAAGPIWKLRAPVRMRAAERVWAVRVCVRKYARAPAGAARQGLELAGDCASRDHRPARAPPR